MAEVEDSSSTQQVDYAELERQYEELMAQTLKLQRRTDKTVAKEHRINSDVDGLRGLLGQALKMNAGGGNETAEALEEVVQSIYESKPASKQDFIQALIDQTDEFSSLERPFRPEVVDNYTKQTIGGAANQK